MKVLSITMLSLFVMALSCRKPEDVPAPSSVIKGKKWKLIYYSDGGTDITANFSNCVLYFLEDQNLEVSDGGAGYSGSWIEFSEPPKLEINVNTSNAYVNLLNGSWENKLLNPTRIELVDNKIAPQLIVKLDLVP